MAEDTETTFETQLEELEAVVARLEEGNLNLDETVALFERGVVLTRGCKTKLASAESRVEAVMSPEADGPVTTQALTFAAYDEDAAEDEE